MQVLVWPTKHWAYMCKWWKRSKCCSISNIYYPSAILLVFLTCHASFSCHEIDLLLWLLLNYSVLFCLYVLLKQKLIMMLWSKLPAKKKHKGGGGLLNWESLFSNWSIWIVQNARVQFPSAYFQSHCVRAPVCSAIIKWYCVTNCCCCFLNQWCSLDACICCSPVTDIITFNEEQCCRLCLPYKANLNSLEVIACNIKLKTELKWPSPWRIQR